MGFRVSRDPSSSNGEGAMNRKEKIFTGSVLN